MKTTWQHLIAAGRPLVADGAMGTNLVESGLGEGEPTGLWNVDQPTKVRRVHRDFIAAGADIILTNSFVCNRYSLTLYGLSHRADELTRAAADNARAEADGADRPVVVGGSIGPSGQMLEPLGELSFDDACACFREQAAVMAEHGVDVFWIETMSDLEEVRAAVEACRQAAADMPVAATLSFDRGGRTLMGTTPEQAVDTLGSLGVEAMGSNCGSGLEEMKEVIARMHAARPSVPLIAKANAGLPRVEGEVAVYDATPENMAAYALAVHQRGASIIGACCGSRPEHLRAMTRALRSA
jgi:5-methyltetrahydrofolate--homocysteine methyltransferase